MTGHTDTSSSVAPSMSGAVARTATLAVVYVATGALGLSLAVVNESASAIWPPTGIAVAALLLFGRGLWPGVAIGAFIVNLGTTGAVLPSLAIAAGNTLEAVLAEHLVRRYANGRHAFERARDVFVFAVAAGLVAPVASATIGVGALAASGRVVAPHLGTVWVTWWLGDALSVLLYASALVLLWTDRRPRRRADVVEALLVTAAIGILSWAVFGDTVVARSNYPLAFLAVPLALWPAFRLGQKETAIAAVLLSVSAVWSTLHRVGPFGLDIPNRGLLLAQTFAGVVGITTAVMAALVAERRRLYEQLERRVLERTEQLRRANAELRAEIANRESVQAALRASEGRLLEAQALAHVGSWEWEIDTGELRWSDEVYRIFGVDRDGFAVHYESFLGLVHPEDRPALEDAVRGALETRGFFEAEHRVIRPDGTERTLAARGRTMCGADGRPTRMVGTGQDVTDRKRAEAQRRQLLDEQSARRQAETASRMKDEFLAVVSHELRTPLNAILGWARMMSAGSLDAAGSVKALQIIDRNALMQARLIDDLLDVSRFETGQAVVKSERVAIGALVRTAVDAIEPAAAARRIGVELTAADTEVFVDGDPARLQQVVSNLLSNAVKFTPEGGAVRVAIDARPATVAIMVTDSGRGIDPADLPRVFEPFWQVDTTLTRTDGGLGLGLAIVRSLVEAHGGTVRVDSQGVGHGARFTVELPRAAERSAGVPAAPGA